MGKLCVRYFGLLFLLVIIGLIAIVSSGYYYDPYSNCEEPACSGEPCSSIAENDCPSPCFCSYLAPGLPLSCNFCSTESCPCSNLGTSMKSCCSGLSCLTFDSNEADGPGTCGDS